MLAYVVCFFKNTLQAGVKRGRVGTQECYNISYIEMSRKYNMFCLCSLPYSMASVQPRIYYNLLFQSKKNALLSVF